MSSRARTECGQPGYDACVHTYLHDGARLFQPEENPLIVKVGEQHNGAGERGKNVGGYKLRARLIDVLALDGAVLVLVGCAAFLLLPRRLQLDDDVQRL